MTVDKTSSAPLTVTVNNRLARRLLREYGQEAEARGDLVWERPSILPWSAWDASLYEELIVCGYETRALLSPTAESYLWEKAISSSDVELDPEEPLLLQSQSTATAVSDAWRLLCEWGLDEQVLDDYQTDEAVWLKEQIDRFKDHCGKLELLDRSGLTERVTEGFEAGAFSIPEKIHFVGFDEMTPSQRRRLDVLRTAGVEVAEYPVESRSTQDVQRIALEDPDSEIVTAIRWAEQHLLEDANATIAFVVPRLSEFRERLLLGLEESFEPEAKVTGSNPKRALYNVSLGTSLAEAPMVHDALSWFEVLCGRARDLDTYSNLLLSPFVTHSEAESSLRALLDMRIRRWARPEMDFKAWVKLNAWQARRQSDAGDGGTGDANGDAQVPHHWLKAIRRLVSMAGNLAAKRQTASLWRGELRRILEIVGWPGDRGLDSIEFQQAKAFGAAIDTMAELDLVQPDGFGFAEIVDWLSRITSETLFQPESPANAPIQVLGPLEASVQTFDHAWLLGFDEAHWPPPAHPNPFLPYELQRNKGMPHATPAREYAYTAQLTERLLGKMATRIIVSHPLREGDTECAPSPFITTVAPTDIEALRIDLGKTLAERSLDAPATRFTDDTAPPLNTEVVPVHVEGGSAVLADQSACPFRAFASHRLAVDAPSRPEAGLDAATAGSIVHRALEQLWGELKGHSDLLGLPGEKLEQLVREAVATPLGDWEKRLPDVFTPHFTALWRQRTETLLLEWLALERDREPFTVFARELEQDVCVSDLEFEVRVDRIDALDDKRQVILDYKTGKSGSRQGWTSERLEEPQLPLYTLATDAEIGAVALAKVRRDKDRGFVGMAASEDLLPRVTAPDLEKGEPEFDETIETWRTKLESLADEFRDGRAVVEPTDSACEYCELGMLCRINDPVSSMDESEEQQQ